MKRRQPSLFDPPQDSLFDEPILAALEIQVLQHALGASHPDSPLGWRNYFLTGLDDPTDGVVCRRLVASGHMREGRFMNDGTERYYHCTDEGIAAAKASRA